MSQDIEFKQFTVCMSKELLEKLRYIAAYDCRSVSSMVRIAIKELVAAFEEKNGEIWL